jgi:hypothetical protein
VSAGPGPAAGTDGEHAKAGEKLSGRAGGGIAVIKAEFGALLGDIAEAWGAEYHVIGAMGHINADSGLGDWPEGQAWLDELIATVSAGR